MCQNLDRIKAKNAYEAIRQARNLEKLIIECRGYGIYIGSHPIKPGYFLSIAMKSCPNLRYIKLDCEWLSNNSSTAIVDFGLQKHDDYELCNQIIEDAFISSGSRTHTMIQHKYFQLLKRGCEFVNSKVFLYKFGVDSNTPPEDDREPFGNPYFYTNPVLDYAYYTSNDLYIMAIGYHCKNLETLDFTSLLPSSIHSSTIETVLMESKNTLRCLKCPKGLDNHLSPLCFQECKKLEELVINADISLTTVFHNLPRLKNLTLFCHYTDKRGQFTRENDLNNMFNNRLEHLEHLDLQDGYVVSELLLKTISYNCPKLNYFRISKSQHINNQDILMFIECCANSDIKIQNLVLENCKHMKESYWISKVDTYFKAQKNKINLSTGLQKMDKDNIGPCPLHARIYNINYPLCVEIITQAATIQWNTKLKEVNWKWKKRDNHRIRLKDIF